MSKAILVLDEMPKSCFECELCEQRDAGDFFCASTGDPDGVGRKKPDWCPLKKTPAITKRSSFKMGPHGETWEIVVEEIIEYSEDDDDD